MWTYDWDWCFSCHHAITRCGSCGAWSCDVGAGCDKCINVPIDFSDAPLKPNKAQVEKLVLNVRNQPLLTIFYDVEEINRWCKFYKIEGIKEV